jgi:hypothetical protein
MERTYPGTSISALLSMLLTKFREVHALTPEEYAEIGAMELQKALREEQ